jgi:hypothetical protein
MKIIALEISYIFILVKKIEIASSTHFIFFKLTFITVTNSIGIKSSTIHFIIFPLAYIFIFISKKTSSIPILMIIQPLTIIFISISISHQPFTTPNSIHKLSLIYSIRIFYFLNSKILFLFRRSS